jgi:hypothetical protein
MLGHECSVSGRPPGKGGAVAAEAEPIGNVSRLMPLAIRRYERAGNQVGREMVHLANAT